MKHKKAAVELQFNWTFTLIAGALILLLFASIAYRQKQLSDIRQSTSSLSDIDLLLSGLKNIDDTTQAITLGSELKIDCSSYTLGQVNKQTNTMIFSPGKISQGKAAAWTKSFDIPFKTANFLYMISKSTNYVVVYSPDSADAAKEIHDGIKTTAKQLLTSDRLSSIKDSSQAALIFVDIPASIPDRLKEKELQSIVQIDSATGAVKFYSKTGNALLQKGSSYAMDSSTMLGAAISEDKESYECTLKKALDRTAMASQVYLQTTAELSKQNTACSYPEELIRNIAVLSAKLSTKISQQDIESLSAAAQELKTKNSELIMLSCTEIY